MEITKIVITGGPCAGKTTAMSWIQNAFSQQGYTVLFIGETATEFIRGGVAPWTCGTNVEYQKCQMRLQLEKERLFERAAKTMKSDKILIVCDRGLLDNKAYMNEEEFAEVLKDIGSNEVELRDNYDAVFHLTSAAKGAEEFYTTENNSARTEDIDTARKLDDKIIAAWTGHPHLRVIDNATDFSTKMYRLIHEIAAFLGAASPFERIRKFLIDMPDVEALERLPNCVRVEIIQTYLKSSAGTFRIRQRGRDGHYLYFQKKERILGDGRSVLVERRLSQGEYLKLLMDADTNMRQIRKTRYCLTYGNAYFEIDVFPFWNDKAMLKCPVRDDDYRPLVLPSFLRVKEEVTDNPNYRNSALASRQ